MAQLPKNGRLPPFSSQKISFFKKKFVSLHDTYKKKEDESAVAEDKDTE